MTDCLAGDVNYNLCVVLTERVAEQQQRLDLLWWGVWALVGLTLVLLIVPFWRAAFGHERQV
jgi:hypothetical protein